MALQIKAPHNKKIDYHDSRVPAGVSEIVVFKLNGLISNPQFLSKTLVIAQNKSGSCCYILKVFSM